MRPTPTPRTNSELRVLQISSNTIKWVSQWIARAFASDPFALLGQTARSASSLRLALESVRQHRMQREVLLATLAAREAREARCRPTGNAIIYRFCNI